MTYTDALPGHLTRVPRRERPWWITCGYELGLLGGLYGVYMIARGAIGVEVAEARDRGLQILAIEQALRANIEQPMNEVLTALPAAGIAFSYLYATLHYLVTPVVLGWIALRRRADYAQARNSLLFATVAGLLTYWLLPTAPPRLLDIGLVDTLAQFSHVGWWGEAASAPRGLESFSNQYAALPSLHVGWAVWVAVWVARHAPTRLVRGGIWAYPALMSVVVIATANHYVIDVLAGVLCVLVGARLAVTVETTRLDAVLSHWNSRHQRRPAAARTINPKSTAKRVEPVDQAADARSPGRIRAADAVVGHLNHECAVGLDRPDSRGRGLGVLRDVGQRFGHDEVAGNLNRRRQPASRNVQHRDRDRAARGNRLQRRAQPCRAQHCGVDPMGKLA